MCKTPNDYLQKVSGHFIHEAFLDGRTFIHWTMPKNIKCQKCGKSVVYYIISRYNYYMISSIDHTLKTALFSKELNINHDAKKLPLPLPRVYKVCNGITGFEYQARFYYSETMRIFTMYGKLYMDKQIYLFHIGDGVIAVDAEGEIKPLICIKAAGKKMLFCRKYILPNNVLIKINEYGDAHYICD
jgi:hypothetical protein